MIEAQLLNRAKAGEEAAFAALTDSLRQELQLHCYRIVGSVQDAEDLVQETLLAAWRGLERFEGRFALGARRGRLAGGTTSGRPPGAGGRPRSLSPLGDCR